MVKPDTEFKNDNTKNPKRKNQNTPVNNQEPPAKKPSPIPRHIVFPDDEDNDDIVAYYNQLFPPIITEVREEDKPLVIIEKEINTLKDLIDLGNMYDETKRYNIDMKILNRMVPSLTELDNMIGMLTVKQDMVDHILFKVQNLDSSNMDMMHTVIQGPPGVGKTEVARIIGKIYLAMGILKNDKFVKATRAQLIGEYLGQTARFTKKMIDSAEGGVLFIDEVYSLGNAEKRDSYSKECIDTLNENLTEMKTNFICIIAGYKKEIETCFFAYNPGLERRFPIRFTIEPYKAEDIFLIFKKKVSDSDWKLHSSITDKFFIDNFEHFKFFGGDMEVLLSRCKRAHARRIFASKTGIKKEIDMIDMKRGFDSFKAHRTIEIKVESDLWKTMFL
jgi:hypothetical protein